ncbi:hypothetical protein ABPG77_006664 [Micractinium sp. CCAP 211/92]
MRVIAPRPNTRVCTCRARPGLSPDAHTKGLIAAINSLQQQQEATEEARHSAAEAAAAAAAEAAELKAALHAALQRAAELDDQEQAVQAALDERLQEQGMLAEQLRLLGRRLASLRGSGPSTQGGSAGASDADQARSPAEMQHQLDLLQKKEAAEELQRRLLTLGLGQGTLAALCSEAEHSSVAGGAVPTMKQQGSSISEPGMLPPRFAWVRLFSLLVLLCVCVWGGRGGWGGGGQGRAGGGARGCGAVAACLQAPAVGESQEIDLSLAHLACESREIVLSTAHLASSHSLQACARGAGWGVAEVAAAAACWGTSASGGVAADHACSQQALLACRSSVYFQSHEVLLAAY